MNDHMWGNGIRVYHSCIILLFLIITLTPAAAAADTMFRANPQHTGVFDNGGIVPTNTGLWRFSTGDTLASTPAVVNGDVYVSSLDNNLYAINAVTGTEKWRFKMGHWGWSSPAVANGVIYVGSDDHNLYAIN
ncbi:MAG: PQQ-binding-like beta-propeller repeat protein, partial [Methanoregula sp.]|nr:PQQ-binding-like beta-propeller repeat protein [Methanoregula sp.]